MRYEHQIRGLEEKINQKRESQLNLEERIDEIDIEVDKIKEKISDLKKAQELLPHRHHEPWNEGEKDKLFKSLVNLIKDRANIHERTEVAIASRIVHENWLIRWKDYRENSNE